MGISSLGLLIRRFATYCVALSIVIITNASVAGQLLIVDQNNNPVSGAVVAFPAPSNFVPDTQSIAVMDQINRQFSPQVLVINKGQKVKFPNSDDIRHHVYSFSEVKPFEIKLYKGSDQAPITFEKSGVSVLGCNIHDGMVGHIYIAEDEVALVSNAFGIIDLGQNTPQSVSIWHSKMSVGSTTKLQYPVNLDNGKDQIVINLLLPSKKPKKRTFGSRNNANGN